MGYQLPVLAVKRQVDFMCVMCVGFRYSAFICMSKD